MPAGTNDWQEEHPWEPSPTAHPEPVPLVKASDLFNPLLNMAGLMNREAPVCSPETPVTEAVRILREADSSALFVVSDGKPVGVLTDRSIALAVNEREGVARLRAEDLMDRQVPTVSDTSPLDVLLDRFTHAGLAVVDRHGRFEGVVGWRELLGHVSERAIGKLVANIHGKAPRGLKPAPSAG